MSAKTVEVASARTNPAAYLPRGGAGLVAEAGKLVVARPARTTSLLGKEVVSPEHMLSSENELALGKEVVFPEHMLAGVASDFD